MREIHCEFNYTTLDPAIAVQIQEAVGNGEMFGLAGKTSITVFAPQQLQSIWISKRSYMSGTRQGYNNLQDLITSVSMALLGQKTFISGSRLLEYCNQNKLTIPKMLPS